MAGQARRARARGRRGSPRSPLPGPAGNVEYFLWLRRGRARRADPAEIASGPSRRGRNDAEDRRVLLVAHTGRRDAATARRAR